MSDATSTATAVATKTGKGCFTPVPFSYTLNDKTYSWAGRGRKPTTLLAKEKELAKIVQRNSKTGQWEWVDAPAT